MASAAPWDDGGSRDQGSGAGAMRGLNLLSTFGLFGGDQESSSVTLGDQGPSPMINGCPGFVLMLSRE